MGETWGTAYSTWYQFLSRSGSTMAVIPCGILIKSRVFMDTSYPPSSSSNNWANSSSCPPLSYLMYVMEFVFYDSPVAYISTTTSTAQTSPITRTFQVHHLQPIHLVYHWSSSVLFLEEQVLSTYGFWKHDPESSRVTLNLCP